MYGLTLDGQRIDFAMNVYTKTKAFLFSVSLFVSF